MNKITRLLLIAGLSIALFSACSKPNAVQPETAQTTKKDASQNTDASARRMVPATPDTVSVRNALAAGPWAYHWLFGDFYQSYSTLLYKNGRATNTADLTSHQITYNITNNTFVEITPQGRIEGCFKLGIWLDDYQGINVLIATTVTYPKQATGGTAHILLLDGGTFIWYDPTNTNNRYAVLHHPGGFPTNGTGTIASRLTGKTWIYLQYFGDYTNPTAKLLYRANRMGGAAPVVDLSGDWVTYYADGTFTNYHPTSGITEHGKWWLTDGDTKIHNQLLPPSTNTFDYVAKIELLASNRFEWSTDITSYYYAEMVPLGTQIGH